VKLNLHTVEDTAQLKYRVAVSLKAELDALNEECRRHKLDFTAALSHGLREVAKALRQQLRAKAGLTVEPNGLSEHGVVK
jgi:hypothetical protein